MKLSDYVVDFIVKQDVTHIFEMIGGAIAHLVDSTYHRKDINCVSIHHEQAGAFAAEGYARMNGKLGVALATSGPGALNLLTGIGSCYFDSVPCLFITGQVNTYEYKFNRPLRQLGFQETDIVNIAKPLTKYAELITDPQSIRYHLEKAVCLAQTGRPGPVLLDIPMNIQRAEIDPNKLESFFKSSEYKENNHPITWDTNTINQILLLISKAERPLVLVGGGIRTAGGTEEFLKFIEKTKIPVVSSLMGLDAIPHDHPSYFGLIGSYGNRYSNLALANCDFLLILGSRLDTRQTGTRPDTFSRQSKKVHVDIDNNELNAKIKVDIALQGDVKQFLEKVNLLLKEQPVQDISNWYVVINRYRNLFPNVPPSIEEDTIHPNRFIELLSNHCTNNHLICLDVGQHQMWASQSFHLKKGQRIFNSGGMGAMGFSLPAAIGISKSAPEREIIIISGDGGIQVNIQELETIKYHKLPIKIFVIHNNNLGMVRQFQDLYFHGRRQSSSLGYSCPDFGRIAEGYGIPAYYIHKWEEAEQKIKSALTSTGPVVIQVKIPEDTALTPKLVVNRPIEDMSPHLDKEELRKLMLIDLLDECSNNERED